METFDFDVVDKIYKPYDNLVLAVTLKADGSTDKQVIGSIAEAIKAQSNVPEEWEPPERDLYRSWSPDDLLHDHRKRLRFEKC